MLGAASVSASAQNVTVNGKTVTVKITSPGQLKNALSQINGKGYTKVVVMGGLNGTDAQALRDINVETLDLSQTTGASGYDFKSFVNNYVSYVILPGYWDKDAVKNCSNFSNLKAAVASGAVYEFKWTFKDPQNNGAIKDYSGDIFNVDGKFIRKDSYNDGGTYFGRPYTEASVKGTLKYNYKDENGELYLNPNIYTNEGLAFVLNNQFVVKAKTSNGQPIYKFYDGSDVVKDQLMVRDEGGRFFTNRGSLVNLTPRTNNSVAYTYHTNDGKEIFYTDGQIYTKGGASYMFNGGGKLYATGTVIDEYGQLKTVDQLQGVMDMESCDYINHYDELPEYVRNSVSRDIVFYKYHIDGSNGGWTRDAFFAVGNFAKVDNKTVSGDYEVGFIGNDKNSYGYLPSEGNPFTSLKSYAAGSKVYVYTSNQNQVYNGSTYTFNNNVVGGTGSDVEIFKVLTDNSGKAYTGKLYVANNGQYYGVKSETDAVVVEPHYIYEYKNYSGETHLTKGTQKPLVNDMVKLVGKDLNIPVTYNDISANFSNQVSVTAYVATPGSLKYALTQTSGFDAKKVKQVTLAGYLNAMDVATGWNGKVTSDGHLVPEGGIDVNTDHNNWYGTCDCPLAESHLRPYNTYEDLPNVQVCYVAKGTAGDNSRAAFLGATNITYLDLEDAKFGHYEGNIFKYYPADMTLSKLSQSYIQSLKEVKLPEDPSQFIIPEFFLEKSCFIREICIPANIKEIHRYAFLGKAFDETSGGAISRYYTKAASDTEVKDKRTGDYVDNGYQTCTLPSSIKFIGRGSFCGYGGSAHGGASIQDVYSLAPNAPICEFYAWDQQSYVGQDGHEQNHLIKKENYVNFRHGFTMLHFQNANTTQERLNYSDMTRKYRLYDETGKYDNLGNILVWPTQAQYNRSFNQALAGVTWYAWHDTQDRQTREFDTTDDPEQAYTGGTGWIAGSGDNNATHDIVFSKTIEEDGWSDEWKKQFPMFDDSESKGGGFGHIDETEFENSLSSKYQIKSDKDRPLVYDYKKYGGWHQFSLTELYDFMLTPVDPWEPKPDYYNFAKYKRNVWYTICFPFNMTKKQLLQAFGNPTEGHEEYPVLSTLEGMTRDGENYKITIHMSRNLLNNKLVYDSRCKNTVKCGENTNYQAEYRPANYDDDDIVLYANKPYFILPCLSQDVLDAAQQNGTDYVRRSEVTLVEGVDENTIQFPIAEHVHALNGANNKYVDGQDVATNDSTYAFNYYFVGNYIPQSMPENAYYIGLTRQGDGSIWSSFFRNSPKKANKMWSENEAIIMAVVENHNTGSKSGRLNAKEVKSTYNGKTANYVWDALPYDDFKFHAGTDKEVNAKNAFGIQFASEDDYTTEIKLPEDYVNSEVNKVYSLSGQVVGTKSENMPKGIYINAGKKYVVK